MHAVTATMFAIAAAWMATPIRARSLVLCHSLTPPLAPRGLGADIGCLRFGLVIGGACVATCWPLMLACYVAGHGLPAMAGAGALGAIERFSYRPRPALAAAGALMLAGVYLML
jgi:predicted metal-binding membrane protein